MLEYLIQLPFDSLGQNLLGFLDLSDIIQFENAATSHESQQLLRETLPYSPPNMVECFEFNRELIDWCNKRRYRFQHATISVETLFEVKYQRYIFDNIELHLKSNASSQHIEPLKNNYINRRVTSVKIRGNQDPAVIEVLFSLLSCVRSLIIQTPTISHWMEHIKQIGPCLHELSINCWTSQFKMLTTITEYCPNLEKLSWTYGPDVSDSNILQSIANNCSHLRILDIDLFYNTSVEADADLTAFAEKCPQLEELNLKCSQLTDQSIIALSQHCSRLKKLKLNYEDNSPPITVSSVIALSERGLPLEKFTTYDSGLLIPSAEIAAQCAYTLSRVHVLNTYTWLETIENVLYADPYMTGLRDLNLHSFGDHLLVPHLLLLLQGHCARLENLSIREASSITPQQLNEIVAMCPQLLTVTITKATCSTDVVLVELARSCPHLQKLALYSRSEVTEEGVLALAAHCAQLREIYTHSITMTEETVRQLVHHCRYLTKLGTQVPSQGRSRPNVKSWSKKVIRTLRLGV